MTHLLDCPFCGGEMWLDSGSDIIHWWRHPMMTKEQVSCPCFVAPSIEEWPEPDLDKIAAWNRRIDLSKAHPNQIPNINERGRE